MKFMFRVDSSFEIGTGHVMRCLTLATALKEKGHECIFISRNHAGNLISHIKQKGFIVYSLNQDDKDFVAIDEYQRWVGVPEQLDAEQVVNLIVDMNIDCCIVDHYGLSAIWENIIRLSVAKIVVIDDLANRKHSANIILDCGLEHNIDDYQKLNDWEGGIYLLGAQYALLRPEFAQLRGNIQSEREYTFNPLKILLNLGGVDKNNVTGQILELLNQLKPYQKIEVTAVLGGSNPWLQHIKLMASALNFPCNVLSNVSNMAELMIGHDIAIGAAGSTTWERCCLGLPTIMVCIADNQKKIAESLNRKGVAISLMQDELETLLIQNIHQLNSRKLSKMRRKSFEITDGLGVSRLVSQMERG